MHVVHELKHYELYKIIIIISGYCLFEMFAIIFLNLFVNLLIKLTYSRE